MKNIVIAGNCGKDAVLRTTQNGDRVLGFSVAVEERSGPEKRTLWFDCALWGKRGEALAQYLTKGTRVTVSGDLSTREHEGRTYLQVRANDVTLMGGGQQSDSRAPADRGDQPRAGHGVPAAGGAPAGGQPDWDEIPFAPEWRL